LEIAGHSERIPFLHPGLDDCNNVSSITEFFQVSARTGEIGGASLPWFTFADSVLLSWWIDKKNTDIGLAARWGLTSMADSDYDPAPTSPTSECRRRLEIHPRKYAAGLFTPEGLLTLDIEEIGDADQLRIINIGFEEGSESPTWTYPLRVAIICVLAPVTVFVNDWIGPVFSGCLTGFLVVFGIFVCTSLFGILLVLLWRYFGGSNIEVVVGRVQQRLDMWQENGQYS
jgi:hypothetical protein